jgi:hypothetical protein
MMKENWDKIKALQDSGEAEVARVDKEEMKDFANQLHEHAAFISRDSE